MKKDTNILKEYIYNEYADIKAIEEYLNEKALEGWHLINNRGCYTFEKCEPYKANYSVELLPMVSDFSNEISPESRNYIDLCSEAGWNYISNTGSIFIFENKDLNATPIVSDSNEKINIITSKFKKTYGLIFPFILIIAIATTISLISSYLENKGANGISLSTTILTIILMVFAVLCFIPRMVEFKKWHKNALKELKENKPITYQGKEILKKRKNVMLISTIGSLLVCIVFGIIGIIIKDYILTLDVVGCIITVTLVLLCVPFIKKREFSKKKFALYLAIISLITLIISLGFVFLTKYFFA